MESNANVALQFEDLALTKYMFLKCALVGKISKIVQLNTFVQYKVFFFFFYILKTKGNCVRERFNKCPFSYTLTLSLKASQLRRLQAQTLPN